ncbi:MAG: cytochrome c5 family protein, partial [Rhodocyclaceae bacterium]|nr:cytochrome c5 family protein [Rhodocyclaceae bacterium]
CGACHASGALNAPKTGDAAAWGPRIALGFDAVVKSAINGKNQMPPKGGAADLTDTEVARAVAYLGNQAGAKFTEPE